MIVYCGEMNNIFTEKIKPLSKIVFDNLSYSSELQYGKCPAFTDYMKNIFVITSPYDLVLNWDKEKFQFNTDFNVDAKEKMVFPRNHEHGLISIVGINLLFFSEKSLLVDQFHPYFNLDNSNFVVIPGSFDIGKHFRPLEAAIHFARSGTIKIKENTPLFYLKFHTEEKIVFKKFYVTEKIKSLAVTFLTKRNFTKRILPLNWYYENTLRKTVLKEIKQNLIID